MRARPILGLVLLSAMVLTLTRCGVVVRGVHGGVTSVQNSTLFRQGRHGALSEQEQTWAKVAWRYFQNNYNPSTGLVNSVDGYPFTTLWHMGDALAALVAARELQLIDAREFDRRVSQWLHFLHAMPLFGGKLPNKGYHTITGAMVNASNQPEDVGWSAIDLGRLLIWLKILSTRYPDFSEYIDKAVLRWDFCDVINRCGTLYGGLRVDNRVQLYQEGRLGYEQYAAMGYRAWGFDTTSAANPPPAQAVKIYGIEILSDGRDPRVTGTPAPVLSLPYLLQGLEFNWDRLDDRRSLDSVHSDPHMADLAQRIYLVQETRYRRENVFTARTDYQLRQPPFLVYDAIFADGYPWNTISDRGHTHPELALVSTRAAFGLWALWKTDYTSQLIGVLDTLYDPERGWYEGRYERTGGYEETITCATNAVILEALLYKAQGKIYRTPTKPSYAQIKLDDVFNRPGRCFPQEREPCD